MSSFHHAKTLCWMLPVAIAGSLCGCGKQPFPLAQVTGVCTCKGEPMSAGLLIFNPVRDEEKHGKKMSIGKPAQALIQPDGSFVLSTYGDRDGAVIGNHLIYLNLAVLEDDDPEQPCKAAVDKLIVEVHPGANHLEIDLADIDSGN